MSEENGGSKVDVRSQRIDQEHESIEDAIGTIYDALERGREAGRMLVMVHVLNAENGEMESLGTTFNFPTQRAIDIIGETVNFVRHVQKDGGPPIPKKPLPEAQLPTDFESPFGS